MIRNYKPDDCKEIIKLFYETVHTVNALDYANEQLDAWANEDIDEKEWNQSLLKNLCLVVEKDHQITGFGDMTSDGYLDRLYVHKDYQNQGIATLLLTTLEKRVKANEYEAYVSVTAKPFFEKRGYVVVKENKVYRKGVELTNFLMKKKCYDE